MKVGQTVYLRPLESGNAYRRDKSVKISTIKKLGRKYVTVDGYGEFEISSGIQKTRYSADYKLYQNEIYLNRQLEKEDLVQRIKSAIPKYGEWDISVERLRRLADILEC